MQILFITSIGLLLELAQFLSPFLLLLLHQKISLSLKAFFPFFNTFDSLGMRLQCLLGIFSFLSQYIRHRSIVLLFLFGCLLFEVIEFLESISCCCFLILLCEEVNIQRHTTSASFQSHRWQIWLLHLRLFNLRLLKLLRFLLGLLLTFWYLHWCLWLLNFLF